MNTRQQEIQNALDLVGQYYKGERLDDMTEIQLCTKYHQLLAAGHSYVPEVRDDFRCLDFVYSDNDVATEMFNASKCDVVYFFYGADDKLLYVGRTDCFRTRWKQHRASEKEMKEIVKVEIKVFETKHEVMFYESQAIAELKPLWNKVGLKTKVSKTRLPHVGSLFYKCTMTRPELCGELIDKISNQMLVYYTKEWFDRQSDQDLIDECNRIADLEYGLLDRQAMIIDDWKQFKEKEH